MRPDQEGLWRVIYIARGERQAQQIEDMLEEYYDYLDVSVVDKSYDEL